MVIYDQYSEFLGIPGHVREPQTGRRVEKACPNLLVDTIEKRVFKWSCRNILPILKMNLRNIFPLRPDV